MGKVKERTNETIQVRMPTIMAAQAFDEAIEAVKNEPNLRAVLVNKDDSVGAAITNGMALELLISWANEMFDAQGFGTGEHKFSNQFYGLIDAQMKNVMKNIKNSLNSLLLNIFFISLFNPLKVFCFFLMDVL